MTGNTIMAGWASEEITPALPCWLGGYMARGAPAHAVHDPLYVRALALGSLTSPFILIMCDVLAINDELLHEARSRLKSLLPGATMWLAATHTHSGPAIASPRFIPIESEATKPLLDVGWPMPEQHQRVTERIIAALIQAVQDAVARMHTVEVAWASSQITGVITNRDYPGSGEDTSLDLLCVYEPAQQQGPASKKRYRPPAVILGSFPGHPTVLGAENLQVSADLPGAFRRQLRALCGKTTWIILATGAAGDMSTRYTRRAQSFKELERLGASLAQQAFEMLAHTRPLQMDAALIRSTSIELVIKSAEDIAALGQYAKTVQAEMQKAQEAGNSARARTLETTMQGIQAATHVVTDQASYPRSVELSTTQFGELALVAVPGELYNRLGVEIKRGVAGPVLLLGYCNGYIGYLPTCDAYAHQDYEVLMSPFAPGSGEHVRDAVIQLLKQPSMTEEGDSLV